VSWVGGISKAVILFLALMVGSFLGMMPVLYLSLFAASLGG
jgi:hypothetical protein